ncbi:MAG: UDP-N-acetylglucosamine 2-epimerase (non-hydrolyzing) [Chitinophagia bacterium]|jgi:UDP-N-acetylglucosamine 2-epimerase (non-hydrolysing)
MLPLKIVTVVGTRPELIRLSRVISALEASPAVNHQLIHTGQNYDYELNNIFFEELGIRKPDFFLDAAGSTASESIGKMLIAIEPIFLQIKPDAVLILGDTNSALAAIAAKKNRIPIFHMEAGNRCFDVRVPEETNRKIVDHLADINLVYSDIAREYLLREGIAGDTIIKTGSPMFEVLDFYKPLIDKSDILQQFLLDPYNFFVVSAHREENVSFETPFYQLIESLNALAEEYKLPIIFSTHPRTAKALKNYQIQLHPLIRSIKPLGFPDYVKLQMYAKAVLSDSGTISEESSILNLRALNIRESHERPEAMEEASVIMTGLSKERILQGISLLESQQSENQRVFRLVNDYSMPNVSEKVVRIIVSYINYVKRRNFLSLT